MQLVRLTVQVCFQLGNKLFTVLKFDIAVHLREVLHIH